MSNRYIHTATMLGDANGRVLITGGRFPESYVPTYRTEIYDPATDLWSSAARMNALRESHTATLLQEPGCASRCGQVLVTGGSGQVSPPSTLTPSSGPSAGSAELYDPFTGQWTLTPPLTDLRSNHTATLLQDGKVLLAGGLAGEVEGEAAVAGDSAEVYDPVTGVFTPTNAVMTRARANHTATRLPDGKVLLAGRIPGPADPAGSSAEIYDPVTRTFSATAPLNVGRSSHTATPLPDGRVLVTGGDGGGRSAELYDRGTWTRIADMTVDRAAHTATLLPTGDVLVAGGNDDNTSAELYNPTTGAWRLAGDMVVPRRHHTATLLRSGTVLATGGACRSSFFPQHATCSWAEVYNGVPGAPTGVTATAGNASATVSWTAPPNGGSPITSYTVTSSPGGITTTVGGSSTSATVAGLTNGATYTFTVTARNAVGSGPASAPSNAVTLATVPGAPTGVTATAGNASATVSWTAPPNGGSPITSYTVTSSPGGITTTVGGSSTSATVAGLTNGVTYTFTVTAKNAVGSGPASAPSNPVKPSPSKKRQR